MNKKYYIETYGCQMNEYDTELLVSILSDHGYTRETDHLSADIVMMNTCSVRENANNKIINRVHELKRNHPNPDMKIGILGCMATNLQEELLHDKNLKLDFIVGPDSYKALPERLQALGSTRKVSDIALSDSETYEDVLPVRKEGINAWVAIMRGCNNFCAYCVVPHTRGRERSRSLESVLAEVRQLVQEGFTQVTLLGQNVNSYSYQGADFSDLLAAVAGVSGVKRIRFTSPHPKDFPDKLIHTMAAHPAICHQVHLPLQSGNDRILNMMNRRYTRDAYLALADRIRTVLPEVAFSTDIIVGFPTETEAEFEDTYQVMARMRYDSAFIFKYSERPQTYAAEHYPDDVPEAVKTARIVRLNALQRQISLENNQAQIGKTQEVIIERLGTRKRPDDYQARNAAGMIVILPPGEYAVNHYITVEITDATANVLKGKLV